MKTKSGFTLLELVVVIAIIALLMGVSISVGSGAIEKARAAKCIANLKSLGSAAANYKMAFGHYPLAGSVEVADLTGGKDGKRHYECVGWIAWLSINGTKHKLESNDYVYTDAKAHQDVEICPYYGTGNIVREHYALSRGKLWNHVYRADSVYVCPSHKILCEKAKLGSPLYSYVMSARFGYDYTRGEEPLITTGDYQWHNPDRPGWVEPAEWFDNSEAIYGDNGTVTPPVYQDGASFYRPDKVLLFAELQGDLGSKSGFSVTGKNSDIWECDAVLQYSATVNGEKLAPCFHVENADVKHPWKGKPESIGFNHRGGQNRYFAHVVFVDGHTEELQAAKTGKGGMLAGGLTYEQLTAILCEGRDYSFDGVSYQAEKADSTF